MDTPRHCIEAAFFAALAGFSILAAEAPATLPCTKPSHTVRFPGGNYGHVETSGNLAVACAGWSREDSAGVFDISDPASVKFVARFPAKGYSCSPPVFFGRRCYVPNGFSATVIDLSDPAKPALEGYLNPSFPRNGCSELWVADGDLYFRAHDGCYKVGADGFTFAKTDKTPPAVREAGEKSVTLRDALLVTDKAEVPFVYCLASVAAEKGTAYVYAQHDGCRGARLLALDARSGGLRLFNSAVSAAPLPKGFGYHTMGMQTAGYVTRVGDLFFTDDGIMRRTRAGGFETVLARTKPVSNSSLDGTRMALAQCSRCRVVDFADLANVKVVDVSPAMEKPLHITGCSLRDNSLFIAFTLVEEKGQDFIYKFPSRGYVASVNLEKPFETASVVEIAPCVDMLRVGDFLYVTGRKGKFTIVDASRPEALRVAGVRDDLLDGDGYKIKNFDGRVFLLNGHRIVELDVADPAAPQAAHLYERGPGTEAPSYDDFTVDDGKLYALAHASLDVFALDDSARTGNVPNDLGIRGVAKGLLTPVDDSVFAGHVPCATPADTLRFKAGRFGNYFGASVYDYVALPDGRFAVAYGEAGVVFCAPDGAFLSELPRGEDGYVQVFAREVVFKDGALYVGDGDGKAWRVGL